MAARFLWAGHGTDRRRESRDGRKGASARPHCDQRSQPELICEARPTWGLIIWQLKPKAGLFGWRRHCMQLLLLRAR